MEIKKYPEKVVQLKGVNNIDIDIQEGVLYIEKEKNDGIFIEISPEKARQLWREGGKIEMDINTHELLHLLDEYTEMEFPPSAIYGIPDDPPFE